MNTILSVSITLAMILAGPAAAHHNMSAGFDLNQRFEASGTAVEVETDRAFEFGRPRGLFRVPDSFDTAEPALGRGTQTDRWNPPGDIRGDGERVVLAVRPQRSLYQITVLDHEGSVLYRVGSPARYTSLSLSPDGSRVAALRLEPRTYEVSLWTWDLSTGTPRMIASE